MDKRWVATGILVLAVTAAWVALSNLVPVPSERFYLLIPPISLALYLTWSATRWKGLRQRLAPALVYVLFVPVLLAGYQYHNSRQLLSSISADSLAGFSIREVLVGVYFVIAVTLLLSLPLSLLHRGYLRLFDRCFAFSPKQQLCVQPVWFTFVRNTLPMLLLVPVIVPYLMGSLYVHRFKVANGEPGLGRPYEDVAFDTADGLTIRGWFFTAKARSARTLMICHGLGANRSNFLPFVAVGDTLEANVLMFDFRGHGDSDGHTISFGHHEKLDVLAAIDYLRGHRPEQTRELMAIAISMGSSALIRAAAEVEPPLNALIIDSGFTSAGELADNVLFIVPPLLRPWLTIPGVPLASLETGCWLPAVRPIDSMARLRAPVLIIHAHDDLLIPADHARRLFERAAQPKILWIADTPGHGSAFAAREQYLQYVRQLVKK